MTRREVIGDATLYLGDCREFAAEIDADIVISDPPYGTGGWRRDQSGQGSNPRASLVKETWDDGAVDWLTLLSPIPILAFVPATPEWLSGFATAGYSKFRWLYMRKMDPRPQVGGRISWSVEPICCASKDGFQLYGGTDWIEASTPRLGRDIDGTGHPYQKPIDVMSWLVQKTKAEFILDPFMGSGTTGIAALRAGRKFAGVEIDGRWFEIACRRIEAEAKQGRLALTEAPAKPRQLSLTPAEAEADSLGSYNVAMQAIGERVKAGEPIPESMRSRKEGR